jgi:hypothetical protein
MSIDDHTKSLWKKNRERCEMAKERDLVSGQTWIETHPASPKVSQIHMVGKLPLKREEVTTNLRRDGMDLQREGLLDESRREIGCSVVPWEVSGVRRTGLPGLGRPVI